MIIHVGLPKCGSTFLQNQIFSKIDKKVYSNELLSGMNVEERELYARGLYNKYGQDLKIILILRNKDDWNKSLYNQNVKSLNTFLKYDEWYKKKFDKGLNDFNGYIKLLDGFFNDVYVYDYEDFIDNKNKFILKLCWDIGCKCPNYDDVRYNNRLNEIESVIFRFNRGFFDFYRIKLCKNEVYYNGFNRKLPGMVIGNE